jgi:predicted kinase
MDLEWRGRSDLADRFVAAYVRHSQDRDLLGLLPYYAAYRALVRGMVDGLTTRDPGIEPHHREAARERARRRFRLAARCAWRADGPAVIACRGLSGSGKTTVALALADRTGFAMSSSDEIRKRRAGLDPRLPTPPERVAALYSEPSRRATYEELGEAVESALARGRAVIADATFTRRDERARIAAVAERRGCPFVVLDCEAPPEVVRERLEQRARRDVAGAEPALSDAGWDVYLKQAASDEPLGPDEPRLQVDTSGEAERVVERTIRDLWSWRCSQPLRRPPGVRA